MHRCITYNKIFSDFSIVSIYTDRYTQSIFSDLKRRARALQQTSSMQPCDTAAEGEGHAQEE